MMREILFRGKRLDNGEWVEDYYMTDPLDVVIRTHEIIKNKRGGDTHIEQSHRVDPTTVGQYTGLRDKNGKRIFEGDVVRCICPDGEFTAVVAFGNPNGLYSWGWQLKPITDTEFNPDILLWVATELDYVGCEIIGSIHDARQGDMPVVMHRKNNGPWMVTGKLDDWMAIYREWEAGRKPER